MWRMSGNPHGNDRPVLRPADRPTDIAVNLPAAQDPRHPRRQRLQLWHLALTYIAWYLLRLPAQWQYDSTQVYQGAQCLLFWLQGRARTLGDVRGFPLFQYLSGMAAVWAGEKGIPVNVFWVWSACSALALVGIVIIFQRAGRRIKQPALSWVMSVVILGGPLVVYVPKTLNEVVAALLALAFAGAVTGTGAPVACALLFFLTGITKETAAPMLLVIWIGGLWMRRLPLSRRDRFMHGAAMAAASVLTVGTNAGFNLVRYRTVWNVHYLAPVYLVNYWPHRLQYCLALWIAPNGGVAMFWPVLVILAIGLVVLGCRAGRIAPAVIVAIVLGALTVGLSGWYMPFGWWAWGPRLMLPWLPACALILIKGYPAEAARLVDRALRNGRAFGVTATLICFFALPPVLAVTQPEVVLHFFDTDARFPQDPPEGDSEGHYARSVYLAWRRTPPMLAMPMLEPLSFADVALAGGYAVALVILLAKARESIVSPHRLVASATAGQDAPPATACFQETA